MSYRLLSEEGKRAVELNEDNLRFQDIARKEAEIHVNLQTFYNISNRTLI